jgi:hypothetical protein
MKRISMLAALTAVAGVAALAASASGSDERATEAKTIRLEGEITAQQPVDNPPAGESAGDLGVFTENLSRAGRRIGEMTGSCVLIRPPAHFQCSAIAQLPEGDLALTANVAEGGRSKGAVTGGTGRYRRARGTFVAKPVAEGRERITIRVLR